MGRIWMPGGGGGADLDAVTAGAGNVEAGKVIVGPDGEPISGAVPNLSQNPDAQYATGNGTPVIKGDAAFMQVNTDNVNRVLIRYDGASERGKAIIQPNTLIGIPAAEMAAAGGLTAAKLAQGQSAFGLTGTYKGLGNAAAADVRSGKTFSTAALSNAAGTMPEQGGSTTTPGTAAKTIVAANRYVTGNIVVAGDANLVPGNIKKNVTIFGVRGTWEGYVASATDLYYRGINSGGFSRIDTHTSYFTCSFDSAQIRIEVERDVSIYTTGVALRTSNSYNLSGYTGIGIRIKSDRTKTSSQESLVVGYGGYSLGNPTNQLGAVSTAINSTGEVEYLVPFSAGHAITTQIVVVIKGNFIDYPNACYITQIRLY